MKIVAVILMLFPLFGYAGHREYFHYDKHEREHNNALFWEDVRHRQYKQAFRIDKGINRGLLTHRETRELKREQKHIARRIRRYESRHYLGERKKRHIMSRLDDLSQKIRALKHNDRYGYVGRAKYNKHSDRSHIRYERSRDDRRDNYISWASNDASAGFYFRF